MADRNLYKVLQVDPAVDADVLTAAYRILAKRLHPEQDSSGVESHRLQELSQAYAILRDPERRRAYDRELAAEAAQARVAMGPGELGHGGSLAERLHAREEDEASRIRIDFGRYTGWTLGELARSDPDYLRWLSRHSSGIRYRGAIMRLLSAREAHERREAHEARAPHGSPR